MQMIETNPEILGGTAVFKGTRVPVRALFDALIAGDSTAEFLQDFPTVSPAHIQTVLQAAEEAVEHSA